VQAGVVLDVSSHFIAERRESRESTIEARRRRCSCSHGLRRCHHGYGLADSTDAGPPNTKEFAAMQTRTANGRPLSVNNGTKRGGRLEAAAEGSAGRDVLWRRVSGWSPLPGSARLALFLFWAPALGRPSLVRCLHDPLRRFDSRCALDNSAEQLTTTAAAQRPPGVHVSPRRPRHCTSVQRVSRRQRQHAVLESLRATRPTFSLAQPRHRRIAGLVAPYSHGA
jgi:hypothetical protein